MTDTGLNAKRALKLIPPAKVMNPTNFFHEAQVLKAVEHPNIVRVEETGAMDDGRIYVAMEYLPKGSLEDEASGAYVEMTRAKRLMIDVLRGLEHAHSQGIIHRDIKPANILIGAMQEGKLSDFGLAIPEGLDLQALGVKDYAYILHLAPEVTRPDKYSCASDIYACGMTMYRLVNGDNYLPAVSPQDARLLARKGKFPDRGRYRDFVPRPLRTFINKALSVDPVNRFKSAEIMRHALEQVTIEKNWREKHFRNGTEWTCGWNQRCYNVICESDGRGAWNVTVRKGATRKSLKRIGDLSKSGMARTAANQWARRILQDFVLGKLR